MFAIYTDTLILMPEHVRRLGVACIRAEDELGEAAPGRSAALETQVHRCKEPLARTPATDLDGTRAAVQASAGSGAGTSPADSSEADAGPWRHLHSQEDGQGPASARDRVGGDQFFLLSSLFLLFRSFLPTSSSLLTSE